MAPGVGKLIRSRWALVVGAILLGLVGALIATSVQEKQYEVQYQLFVAPAKSGSPLEDYQGSFYAKDRIVSYVQLLQTEWMAQRTIEALGLDMSPSAFVKKIEVEAAAQSVLIDIAVRDADPAEAVRIAQGLSETFREEVALVDVPTDGGGPAVAVKILPAPGLPSIPVSPRLKVNLAIGALIGLLIGFAASHLLERIRPRRNSEIGMDEKSAHAHDFENGDDLVHGADHVENHGPATAAQWVPPNNEYHWFPPNQPPSRGSSDDAATDVPKY